jgi:hypothetical protein
MATITLTMWKKGLVNVLRRGKYRYLFPRGTRHSPGNSVAHADSRTRVLTGARDNLTWAALWALPF